MLITTNGLMLEASICTIRGAPCTNIFRKGGLTEKDNRLLYGIAASLPGPATTKTWEQWQANQQYLIALLGIEGVEMILPGSPEEVRSLIEQALQEQAYP